MIKDLKKKIEERRNSRYFFHRALVFSKDFVFYRLHFNIYRWRNALRFYFLRIGSSGSPEGADFSDTTFIIPVKYDSDDRKRNLEYVIQYLQKFSGAQILIGEEGGEKYFDSLDGGQIKYLFFEDGGTLFHKTKVLNNLIKAAKTRFVAVYDADVLVNPGDVSSALRCLRKEKADAAYPYNGQVFDLSPEKSDRVIFGEEVRFRAAGKTEKRSICFGGACILSREILMAVGLENENFVSWGAEDDEFYERCKKLGRRIIRTSSPLVHLYHPPKANRNQIDSSYADNLAELNKIKNMDKEELLNYIQTWSWVAQEDAK